MKHIMERVINEAIDHGAQADVILSKSKSLRMSAQQGSLSEYKVSSSQVLGIRLIKDDRIGISYSESLDPESLKLMIQEALQNAETNDPRPSERIPSLSGEAIDECYYEESEVDISEKITKAIELEEGMKKLDGRVEVVPYNGYAESDFHSYYLSSHGRFTRYNEKSYQIWTSALMAKGQKKSTYHDFDIAHTFGELQWTKIMEKSLFHAGQLLEEQSLETGKYRVHFSIDALKDLLGVFTGIFSSKAAMDEVNPWAKSLGEMVTSPDLTIVDNPLFQDSFRISKFDSEGVMRKPVELVREGILQTFYHNSSTAAHFGTQTTGHAARGPQSSLGIQGTDLIIQGRNVRPLPNRYLEVIQMDGLHAGTNRITGDFSLPVKGYLWENGERKMSFGGVTLSGNFFQMLKNVEVNGETLLTSTDRGFFSVPLMFTDLSIAGS